MLAKTKFRRQAQVKSQVSVIIHWRCATPTTSPESNATTNPSPEGGTDPKSGKAVVIMEEPSHHYGVGVPPHQINTPHVAMWIILQMENSILLQPMGVLSVESWKIYFKGHQVYTEFSIHYIGEARNDKQPANYNIWKTWLMQAEMHSLLLIIKISKWTL